MDDLDILEYFNETISTIIDGNGFFLIETNENLTNDRLIPHPTIRKASCLLINSRICLNNIVEKLTVFSSKRVPRVRR